MSAEVIQQMMLNPPDPNEPLPLSNRRETVYGAVLPFLVVSWIAVSLRLWVRIRIVKEPGWDDLFVVLAALSNTVASVFVVLSIEYGGLGHHFLYLPVSTMQRHFKYFYVEFGLYVTESALVKISLLCQYLRIFKAGTMRRICMVLVVIIGLWGLTYGFLAWVPCFPVRDYWDRKSTSKCYGFGFADQAQFIALFESHTALNMGFDIAVFMTPMVLFTQPSLRKKNILAMAGVFLLGAVVVMTSVWRMYTIVINRAATRPYIDFTWWTPISVLLTCLEIDLAIMCASIPIFWPIIEKSIAAIFVTNEVHVTEHRRSQSRGLAFELEHTRRDTRAGSLKSDSGNSRESLTREEGGTADLYAHYKDAYVLAQVDPLANEANPGVGVATEIESKPKPKWRI